MAVGKRRQVVNEDAKQRLTKCEEKRFIVNIDKLYENSSWSRLRDVAERMTDKLSSDWK